MDNTLYCPRCGEPMAVASEHLSVEIECPHCRHLFVPRSTTRVLPIEPELPSAMSAMREPTCNKLTAGLFGIFLGGFGIHRFYLGYVGIGVLQIIVTVIGWHLVCCFPVGHLWGFVEGVLCLMGKMKDAQGRPLVD